jgi:predicted extracellular nuclease
VRITRSLAALGMVAAGFGAAGQPTVPIHEIQGSGRRSSVASMTVRTQGIVTAVRFNNGFFLQTPDADADGDAATSEAIFVFTSSAPPAIAAVGNLVQVTGVVTEFVPAADPASPPMTELVSPTVTLVTTGQTLPAPIVVTAGDASPAGPLEALERLEGMRVRVDALTVVGPTGGSLAESTATATSNGVFYGVIAGLPRPFREPGVQVPDPLPPGSPAGVPRFDANPERIRVDSDGQVGAQRLEVSSGATVTNLVGVLDYAFRTYSILPDPSSPPSASGGASVTPVPDRSPGEFTVATANLQRFFDTVDDGGVSDVALTAGAFAARLNKVSLLIRNVMRSPDILGVQEVENLSTLRAIADKVNADAMAAGSGNPEYVAYLEDGNDPGGIDVGVLVKSSRVVVREISQVGRNATFVDPRDGSNDLLHDRPPLVLRADVGDRSYRPLAVTVIVNHFRSLNEVNDPTDPAGSNWVRVKRGRQAEFVANLVQDRQRTERVIVIGDFNAFEFSDGLVDSLGTVRGLPAPASEVAFSSPDLVDPDLFNVAGLAPVEQRYSYVFDGSAQSLDHILVSSSARPFLTRMAWARSNADVPESRRSLSMVPDRISDHDPLVAYFRLSCRRTFFGQPIRGCVQ